MSLHNRRTFLKAGSAVALPSAAIPAPMVSACYSEAANGLLKRLSRDEYRIANSAHSL